jgi:hypothetical protein
LLSLSSLRGFALTIFVFLFLPAAAQAQSTGGAQYVAPPPENMVAPGA